MTAALHDFGSQPRTVTIDLQSQYDQTMLMTAASRCRVAPIVFQARQQARLPTLVVAAHGLLGRPQ